MTTSRAPQSTHRPRVAIVDDHPVVRAGLRDILSSASDLAVCGEAEGIEDALDVVAEKTPDVLIVDIGLKRGSGIDLCVRVQADHPAVRVLVCSGRDETFYAERLVQLGARGFVQKDRSAEELIAAVRTVASGGVHFSASVRERLIARWIDSTSTPQAKSGLNGLSGRELEVLELMGRGLTTQAIAERLSLSRKTIESYQQTLKRKLSVRNANELIRAAVWFVLEGSVPLTGEA